MFKFNKKNQNRKYVWHENGFTDGMVLQISSFYSVLDLDTKSLREETALGQMVLIQMFRTNKNQNQLHAGVLNIKIFQLF